MPSLFQGRGNCWCGLRRVANSSWDFWCSASLLKPPSVDISGWRNYAGRTAPAAEDEFWVVEGEMLRVKKNQDKGLLKVIEKAEPSVNPNLSKKQIAANRLKRVMASRLVQTEALLNEYSLMNHLRFWNDDNPHRSEKWDLMRVALGEKKGQETYWTTYFERYRSLREQSEQLFWDGIPEEKPAAEIVDKNDPFTILGLKRRDKPYSPVEIRSAYREKALKYHPDHNPGKDAAAKFERVWNAYKMLQHKRSWR